MKNILCGVRSSRQDEGFPSLSRLVELLPDRRQVVLMGYSSGARMAAAMAYRHPQVSCAAVLFRPQPPFFELAVQNLSGLPACGGILQLAVHVKPGRVRVIPRGGYDWIHC